ncbi:MAG: APC family permease [Thermoproteota archaeon]
MKTVYREKLKRELNYLSAFAYSYADVGSTVYFTLGLVILYASSLALIVFLIGAVPYVLIALTYAELSSSIPDAGGAYLYTSLGMGKLAAFLAAWWLMLDYVVTLSYGTLMATGYLGYFVPFLHRREFFIASSSLLLIALLIINIIGIKESSKVSCFMVLLSLFGLSLFLISGFLLGSSSGVISAPPISLDGFFKGLSVSMASYVGIEVVGQIGGEVRKPSKDIPKAIYMTSFLSVLVAIAISYLSLRVAGWETISMHIKDPLSVVALKIPFLGTILATYISITGFLILLSTVNSGLVGISRLARAMSASNQLPTLFGKLHPKFETPYVSLVVFSCVSLAITSTGNIELVADLYLFGAFSSYILVSLSLMMLRWKKPRLYRPLRTPSLIVGNKEIPLVSVLNLPLLSAVIIIASIFKPIGFVTWIAWTIAGVAVYILQKRHVKKQ